MGHDFRQLLRHGLCGSGKRNARGVLIAAKDKSRTIHALAFAGPAPFVSGPQHGEGLFACGVRSGLVILDHARKALVFGGGTQGGARGEKSEG